MVFCAFLTLDDKHLFILLIKFKKKNKNKKTTKTKKNALLNSHNSHELVLTVVNINEFTLYGLTVETSILAIYASICRKTNILILCAYCLLNSVRVRAGQAQNQGVVKCNEF